MTAIDLSKQQVLNADPKSIEQINFTRNLDRVATIFLRYWRGKRKFFGFFYKELWEYSKFILI